MPQISKNGCYFESQWCIVKCQYTNDSLSDQCWYECSDKHWWQFQLPVNNAIQIKSFEIISYSSNCNRSYGYSISPMHAYVLSSADNRIPSYVIQLPLSATAHALLLPRGLTNEWVLSVTYAHLHREVSRSTNHCRRRLRWERIWTLDLLSLLFNDITSITGIMQRSIKCKNEGELQDGGIATLT